MAWSKVDEIRINAYVVKVRNGMPIEDVPAKYRDDVERKLNPNNAEEEQAVEPGEGE